jgi:hypothetical protein
MQYTRLEKELLLLATSFDNQGIPEPLAEAFAVIYGRDKEELITWPIYRHLESLYDGRYQKCLAKLACREKVRLETVKNSRD